MTETPALEARGLSFSYTDAPEEPDGKLPGRLSLLRDVSFALYPGQWAGLIGLSGCGKSTLCQLLAGIIPRCRELGRKSGQALLFGAEVGELPLADVAQNLGLVLQDPDSQLFSPLVEDELAFGPENLCLPRPEIERRISRALELTGMSRFRLAATDTLSGGQKQLIAVAAVLACQPRVLLLDESFAFLDQEAAARLQQTLLILRQQGTAILTVEHELSRLTAADQVYELREGRLRPVSL